MRKVVFRILINLFLVSSLLIFTMGGALAALEEDEGDKDLTSLDDLKDTGTGKVTKTTTSATTNDGMFTDLGFSEVEVKGSDFKIKENIEKTKPLWPKMGMVIAVAFLVYVATSAVAPLIGGSKSNTAATFNSHKMKKEGIEAIATPPLVMFFVSLVFGLMSVLIGWF